MADRVEEVKRMVERRVDRRFQGRPVHMDELFDHVQREVSLARREDPTLDEYHLHDLTLLFQNQAIILLIDFRK